MTAEPTATGSPADAPGSDGDIFCLECDYNLRGQPGDRCPECGRPFDRASLLRSQIPWAHRERIGAFRAYWRTVWWVGRRTTRFCRETARPVGYHDAQRFRWVTVLHAYLPILLGTLVVYAPTLRRPLRPFAGPVLDGILMLVWPVVAGHLGLVLFLAAATGVPSYLFHPRCLPVDLQNRAIALSYYACAPLAWTPFVLLLLLVGWVPLAGFAISMGMSPWNILDVMDRAPSALRLWLTALASMALIVMLLQPIVWLRVLVHLAWRVMPQRRVRVILLVALPIVWFVLAILTLLGIPLVVTYVGLIFVSLG